MIETTLQPAAVSFHWRNLLRLAAIADLFVLLATAVILDDLLAAVLAGFVLLGLLLLPFRTRWIGLALLGLVFADIAVWTLSGAVSNILQGERFIAILLPSALATISLAGVVAAGGVLARRREPSAGGKWAPFTGITAMVVFLLFLAASFLVRREAPGVVLPTDISVTAENMAFKSKEIAAHAGEITLHLDNHDLWWHTFTIDELGVNLQVPMGANQQVSFTAPAGSYRYYCDIPGHEALGMEGTLVVAESGPGQ